MTGNVAASTFLFFSSAASISIYLEVQAKHILNKYEDPERSYSNGGNQQSTPLSAATALEQKADRWPPVAARQSTLVMSATASALLVLPQLDTKADDFTWIPLDTFGQKCPSASSIGYPYEVIKRPKTAFLKNVNFQCLQGFLLPDRNADNAQQTITHVDEQDPASLQMERTTTNAQKQVRLDLSIGATQRMACLPLLRCAFVSNAFFMIQLLRSALPFFRTFGTGG